MKVKLRCSIVSKYGGIYYNSSVRTGTIGSDAVKGKYKVHTSPSLSRWTKGKVGKYCLK